MLTFAASIAIVALLVAIAALLKARHSAKRAERLAESYWDLRYEMGQLKARLTKIDATPGGAASAPDPEPPAKAASTTSFVPLSSLKK